MLFGKKKKKQEQLDEKFARVTSEIQRIDDWDDPKKIEHYILDSCEQIISLTKEIESEKTQYRVLTMYLTDIRKIRNLPEERSRELKNVAGQILTLTASKNAYQNSEKKISDEDYILMEENEEAVPSVIYRMQENERYQAGVKREMQRLEGQKGQYEMDRSDTAGRERTLRILSILFLIVFASLFIFLLILRRATDSDQTILFLCLLAFGAVAGFGIFLQSSALSKEGSKAKNHLNRTISLLNVVRMKYANVTSAIEFEKKHYHVASSYDLNYKWEMYLETVREKEQYLQNNDDLEYFTGRLMRILAPLELYDRKIWLNQTAALTSADDLQRVNEDLVRRRAQIREQITQNMKSVQSERNEVDRLMREHNFYEPEILEIISSVDRLCGLNRPDANVPPA